MPSKKDNNSESFVPNSSFLELVSYDSKSKTLTVTFKEGNQRKYTDTSQSVYDNFKQAVNHSVYYSKLIKGSGSVPVVSHNVSTKAKTNPLNKQPGAKPYGSDALSRSVRSASRGTVPQTLRKS